MKGSPKSKTKFSELERNLANHSYQAMSRSEDVRDEIQRQFSEDFSRLRASLLEHNCHETSHSEHLLSAVRTQSIQEENFATAYISAVAQLNSNVMSKLDSISNRLGVQPSMSGEQSLNFRDLVKMMESMQFEMQSIRQSLPKATNSRGSTVPYECNLKTNKVYDLDIERGMARLSGLASTTRRDLYSEAAESVIEDLGIILISIMEQIRAESPCGDKLSRKRKKIGDYEHSETERRVRMKKDFARACHILKASQQLQIQRHGKGYFTALSCIY